jgi:hypothetical protein
MSKKDGRRPPKATQVESDPLPRLGVARTIAGKNSDGNPQLRETNYNGVGKKSTDDAKLGDKGKNYE